MEPQWYPHNLHEGHCCRSPTVPFSEVTEYEVVNPDTLELRTATDRMQEDGWKANNQYANIRRIAAAIAWATPFVRKSQDCVASRLRPHSPLLLAALGHDSPRSRPLAHSLDP